MPFQRTTSCADTVMYLEGSDQHRGWFQSSLLESCGTRGTAPFDAVLTHGFVLDEDGRKMSKSLGNVVAPQDVMKQSGADILRMWVAASDYADDLSIGIPMRSLVSEIGMASILKRPFVLERLCGAGFQDFAILC